MKQRHIRLALIAAAIGLPSLCCGALYQWTEPQRENSYIRYGMIGANDGVYTVSGRKGLELEHYNTDLQSMLGRRPAGCGFFRLGTPTYADGDPMFWANIGYCKWK